MTLDDVRALDATLQAQGESISANKIVTELGGSKRDALRLLRELRAEAQPPPPMPPAAPTPAPVCAPGPAADAAPAPTLLQQAEAAYQAALADERQARRAYDLATDLQERERC
jgi:hypothetical protein